MAHRIMPGSKRGLTWSNTALAAYVPLFDITLRPKFQSDVGMDLVLTISKIIVQMPHAKDFDFIEGDLYDIASDNNAVTGQAASCVLGVGLRSEQHEDDRPNRVKADECGPPQFNSD